MRERESCVRFKFPAFPALDSLAAGRGPPELPAQPGGLFILPPELPGLFLATVTE